MERWFYIDVQFACYGIGALDSKIFFAPPIAEWMVGKTLLEIKPYLLEKKANVIELKPGNPSDECANRFKDIVEQRKKEKTAQNRAKRH